MLKKKKNAEKMVDNSLTPKDLDALLRSVSAVLSKAKIPYYIAASHPEDEELILASGGSAAQLIYLSQEVEIDARENVAESVIAHPEQIPELARVIRELDQQFGKKRADLKNSLSEKLMPTGKTPQNPGDLDPSDPEKFFEGLAEMAKDPNCKIEIMGFSPGAGKRDPAEAFGDLMGMVSRIKQGVTKPKDEKAN